MSELSFAQRIRSDYLKIIKEYTSVAPVRVGALAQALGLKVVESTLPLSISGMIKPTEEDSFIIRINRFESKERKRFTIAHEIAHFLLHRDMIAKGVVDSVLYRSKLSSRTEAEANRLAADILMPRNLVSSERALVPSTVKDVDSYLADRFRVSRSAMDIRTG